MESRPIAAKNAPIMSATYEEDPLHRALIERLGAARGGHDDPRAGRLLMDLLDDAIAMVGDGVEVADLKLVASAVAEMRTALGVFRSYGAGRRKVTAFGSARTKPEEPVYRLAHDFGRRLADAGMMAITGGGPGIMGAVLEGAGRDHSFGVGIRLPFEQLAHEVLLGDPKLVEFKYFFTRKLFFLKEASAVVLFPGGFGTHDEGFETLTLVQTGKSRLVPVVCLDVEGSDYWKGWDAFVREQLLARGLISAEDVSLYRIETSAEAAVADIVRFYRVFHSSRTIRGRTILRLARLPNDDVLAALSDEFAHILDGQPIRAVSPYREEADEPETLSLARLALDFDRLHYGRLRALIDRLNDLEEGDFRDA